MDRAVQAHHLAVAGASPHRGHRSVITASATRGCIRLALGTLTLTFLRPLLLQHAFLFRDDKKAHAAIKEVIAMYKAPSWLDGRPVDTFNINVANDCYLCAMLLTDTVITAADIAASNQQ